MNLEFENKLSTYSKLYDNSTKSMENIFDEAYDFVEKKNVENLVEYIDFFKNNNENYYYMFVLVLYNKGLKREYISYIIEALKEKNEYKREILLSMLIKYYANNKNEKRLYKVLLEEYQRHFNFFVNHKEYMLYLGKMAMEKHDYDNSIDIYFDLSIKYKNDNSRLLWKERRAMANLEIGKLLEADRIFENLERKYPEYKRPYVKKDDKKIEKEIKMYRFDFFNVILIVLGIGIYTFSNF